MMESELNQRFKFIVQGTPEQKASLEVSLSIYSAITTYLDVNERFSTAFSPSTPTRT